MEALLKILFNLTFAMHYSFVMLVVGIPLWALVEALTGRYLKGPAWLFLKNRYPACISLLITTGVAPLLFSQFIHHKNFYQSFINLNPLPLIGLVMLVVFFYIAYFIERVKKWAFPLILLQLLFLLSFVLFFSTLFQSINHPQHYISNFWNGTYPAPNWPMVAVHFGAALIGAAIFLFLGMKRIVVSGVVLILISFGMAYYRESIRMGLPEGSLPKLLTTELDPSFYLFALFFVVMIVVLLYVKRLVR